ncbi:MAG: serpin family protein [Lachnospiraceae bacterium]|nr:serpin family protein [Lachnospiraceae bacterium]
MDRNQLIKRTFSLLLCCSILSGLVGCSTGESLDDAFRDTAILDETPENNKDSNAASKPVADLMADFSSKEIAPVPDQVSEAFLLAASNFSVKLLKQTITDPISANSATEDSSNTAESSSNCLISPLSVLTALSMTTNGAAGKTQKEMLQVLCGDMSVEELNQNLYSLISGLPSSESAKLLQANSIWFRDEASFDVKKNFLQTNAWYFKAELFKTSFDEKLAGRINSWVSEHTKKRIKNLIDQVPPEAMMYLINALTFDAKWSTPYTKNMIADDIFTQEDGTKITVPMMTSSENLYLEMSQAKGFIKPYKEGYSFAALLPDKNISLHDFIKNLSGKTLRQAIANASDQPLRVKMPKFKSTCKTELSQALAAMGMPSAFTPNKADFSNISSEELVISRVLHSTSISVHEKGSEAGAATAVEMAKCSIEPETEKRIELNRPFLYLIIDQATGFPVFIGTADTLQ